MNDERFQDPAGIRSEPTSYVQVRSIELSVAAVRPRCGWINAIHKYTRWHEKTK